MLALAPSVGPERLEAACRRALAYDSVEYPTVKRILAAGLEREPAEPAAAAPPRYAFVRSAGEFVAGLLGGAR